MNQNQPPKKILCLVRIFHIFTPTEDIAKFNRIQSNLAECLRAVLENPEQDDWAGEIKEIEEAIEAIIPNLSLSQPRERVCDVAIGAVIIQYRNVGSFKVYKKRAMTINNCTCIINLCNEVVISVCLYVRS